LVHRDNLEIWKKSIKEHIEKNKEVGIGDIKTILGTTRKYIVPIAEYLDEIKFTRRVGDKRVLY
jgi:selenocysteine-specific elongation factor